MRKIITLLFVLATIVTNAQFIPSGVFGQLKQVSRENVHMRHITNPSRSVSNIALDYDSFDRRTAVQNSQSVGAYAWAINSRNTNDSVFTLRYAVQTFDTLMNVNNNFASTAKQNVVTRLDSFDVALLHGNYSGLDDTFIISVFDKNTATVTGTGVTSTLNTTSLWADTIIFNGNFFGSDTDFFALTFKPNVTFPTGHVAGVKIEFRGPIEDQLNTIASLRLACGPISQTVLADTNKASAHTASYYLNLAANSGFYNYSTNLAINSASACKYYYIQNFYVFPYMTITTNDPATVVTTAATNVASTTATINGTVNANGSSTATSFEWGLTTSYGNTATASPATVTGSTTTNISANLSNLTASTTYHYRAKGVNAGGTTNGADLTFTTAAAGTVCTPDANVTTFSPSSDNVPCIEQGVSFSQTYSFKVPTGGGAVISITIDSVGNLPSGLTATFSKNPATYAANEVGCILVTGTTNAPCGQYRMKIYVAINSALSPGNPIKGELSDLTATYNIPGFPKNWLRVIAQGGTCPAVDANQANDFTAGSCGLVSLSATATATNVNCFGGSTGTATVVATGGTNYTYLWSNQATTATISGLAAGSYTVTVTEGNATATASVTVTQPASAVSLTGSTTNAIGSASNGAVNLTVTGGTSGYTYNWSNQATTEDLTAVAAGSYTVTVTDSKGCTATATYTVGSSVGINGIQLVNKFEVFPNPATSSVNVKLALSDNTDVKLEILDINGKLMIADYAGNVSLYNNQINTSALANGVYVIRLSGSQLNVTQRLTIAK